MAQSTAVHDILSQLTSYLERHYDGLRTAFLNIDSDQNGWLSGDEFAAVFKSFNWPLSLDDLEVLIDAFDYNKDGYVSYLEFCNTINNGPYAPMNIAEPAYEVPEVPVADETPKTISPTDRVKSILMQLGTYLEKHYEGLRSAFLNCDRDQNGWLSDSEIAAIFKMFNAPLSDEDLALLIDAFDANKDGCVSYLEFCNTLLNGPWAPMRVKETPITNAAGGSVKTQEDKDLEKEKVTFLLTHLRKAVSQRFYNMQEAFIKLDGDRTGFISAQELMSVLLGIGVKVSWDEMQLLVDYFDVNGDGLISYQEFCGGIQMMNWNPSGQGDSTIAAHPKSGKTIVREAGPSEVAMVHAELRKYLSQRCSSSRDGFLYMNTSRSGKVTQEELAACLLKACDMMPSDECISALFEIYDANQDGVISFSEYVKGLSKVVLE